MILLSFILFAFGVYDLALSISAMVVEVKKGYTNTWVGMTMLVTLGAVCIFGSIVILIIYLP
jgi:hypothetical protein